MPRFAELVTTCLRHEAGKAPARIAVSHFGVTRYLRAACIGFFWMRKSDGEVLEPEATGSKVSSSVLMNISDGLENSFVSSLACVLTHLVSLPQPADPKFTRFHSVKIPSISILDYLRRLQKYFACTPECFVLSLVYIDRIIKAHPDFSVCEYNVHRLLVTAVMIAAKFFDDLYYSNAYYAKVGGIKTRELNVLEVHLLGLLNWRLFVGPEEFDQYKNHVLMAVIGPPEEGD